MTLSPHKKIVINKILDDSLGTRELEEIYRQFLANRPVQRGVTGWEILNRIAEEKGKYRGFIQNFGEDSQVQTDVGNFVIEVIRKKKGFP
jgi:hypothetical protein